jgi:hypothetical protein
MRRNRGEKEKEAGEGVDRDGRPGSKQAANHGSRGQAVGSAERGRLPGQPGDPSSADTPIPVTGLTPVQGERTRDRSL